MKKARTAADEAAASGGLSGEFAEEARLIAAKVALRAGETDADDLPEARRQLTAFLATRPSAARASEARGWLARVTFLEGHGPAAVRQYLDELDRPGPGLSSKVLVDSIRVAFNKDERAFVDHAADFFDTPRHALFVVNVVTNPESEWAEPRPEADKRRLGQQFLGLLRGHTALFDGSADANALTLALMRMAIYMGDPAGAAKDATRVKPGSALMANVEFNWMLAGAHALQGKQAEAEAPLLRMLNATAATAADRATAAQALVGVYLATHRPVEALHAAFVHETTPFDDSRDVYDSTRMQWCVACQALDLPYLLDVGLTDAELATYLEKYPKPFGVPISVFRDMSRKMSPPDVVRYSQAVRSARRGDYERARRLYVELGVTWRAARMEKLAQLATRAADTRLDAAARLDARMDIATFLAQNSERVLFNDLLWRGFQTMALTDDDEKETAAKDRALRDSQEELWQAARMFEAIALDRATRAGVARQAGVKMLDALVLINTGRFGRENEINALVTKWKAWLRR